MIFETSDVSTNTDNFKDSNGTSLFFTLKHASFALVNIGSQNAIVYNSFTKQTRTTSWRNLEKEIE